VVGRKMDGSVHPVNKSNLCCQDLQSDNERLPLAFQTEHHLFCKRSTRAPISGRISSAQRVHALRSALLWYRSICKHALGRSNSACSRYGGMRSDWRYGPLAHERPSHSRSLKMSSKWASDLRVSIFYPSGQSTRLLAREQVVENGCPGVAHGVAGRTWAN
jgi:hypothetical protein